MKIGILGGGRVGTALASTWRAKGHAVIVSTRDTLATTAGAADVLVLAGRRRSRRPRSSTAETTRTRRRSPRA